MRGKWQKYLESLQLNNFKPRHLNSIEWPKLTHHHKFSGNELCMLGISRRETLGTVVEHIERVCTMTDRSKENNPYLAIHAAPRQGKSLFLDLLCEGLRSKEYTAIAISYNSSSDYTQKEDSNIAGWFFARIIATILKACKFPIIDFNCLSPYIDILKFGDVIDVCSKCISGFNRSKFVVVVDEFTKCLAHQHPDKLSVTMSALTSTVYSNQGIIVFSGFGHKDTRAVTTSSGRPVRSDVLLPVLSENREEMMPLITKIRDSYINRNVAFPHFIYECTKFSPGLMGYWLELLLSNNVVYIEQIIVPILPTLSRLISNHQSFFDNYWKNVFMQCTDPYNIENCFDQYEEQNCLLHTHNTVKRGLLNPFIIFHPYTYTLLSCQYEKFLFSKVKEAFSVTPWNTETKGKALEVMLVLALCLRHKHTPDKLEFGNLLKRMCGNMSFCQSW